MLLQHGSLGFVNIGQDTGAVLVKALPGVGQVQLARRAPQQLYAQPILE